jgi:hypothetical protein
MQINRNNYETFLIDYLEGLLDDQQKQEVEAFLLVNSDIFTEFEAYQSGLIIPDEINFSEKETLLNIPFLTAKSNDLFFNQKCIEKIEGILPPCEEMFFKKMVHKSPDHLYAFQTYFKTKIPADYSIYDEKILIKIDETNPVLNNQNFAGYAIAYLEGWLNNEARKSVEKYQKEQESAREVFSLVKRLKINPDYLILYPDKSILKKELTVGQRIQKNFIYWGSIAAILVVGVFAFYTSQNDEFTTHQNGTHHQSEIQQKSIAINQTVSSVPKKIEIINEKKLIKEPGQTITPAVKQKNDEPVIETRETVPFVALKSRVAKNIYVFQITNELELKSKIAPDLIITHNNNVNESDVSKKTWLAETFKKATYLGIKQFNKSGKGKVKIERQEEKKRMKVQIETRYFALSTTKSINN